MPASIGLAKLLDLIFDFQFHVVDGSQLSKIIPQDQPRGFLRFLADEVFLARVSCGRLRLLSANGDLNSENLL